MGLNKGYKTPDEYIGTNPTFGDPSSVTIGNTSTLAIAANTNRKYLVISNDSTEDMYISFGSAAVINKGLRLNANGGTLEWFGPNVFGSAVYAITASGNKRMTYQEAA